MNIFMTGITGFVGQKLSAELQKQGHSIIGLTRRPIKTDPNHNSKLRPKLRMISGDLYNAATWQHELKNCQAIIALAGEPVVGKRWTPKVKQKILKSRVDGLHEIYKAVSHLSAEQRPKILLSASAIGYYGSSPTAMTESGLPGSGFLADVCVQWEAAAFALQKLGLRVDILRIGLVLGTQGGMLQKMLPLFRWFLGGRLGSGKQYLSWIHIEDLVGLFLFALNDMTKSEAINATAPHPVTMQEFVKTLGKVLHRPALFAVPAWALKLALGEAAGSILQTAKVLPTKALDLGYRFKHETLENALENLLNASI